MILNPKIKLALNDWAKAKTDTSTPSTLKDFSDISFGIQTAILKKAFKKLLTVLPTKENPIDFLLIGACGFKGEQKDDNPLIVIGEMTKYKGFVNKKIKEKDNAKGVIYIENDNTICFLFQKGKIKNESKAKKILKPLKSLFNKFDIKFLFSEEVEADSDNITNNDILASNQDNKDELANKNIPSDNPSLRPEAVQLAYAGKAQKINPKAELILREILAQAGEAQATITSTYRSVGDQTKVIIKNIVQYGVAINMQHYNGYGKILVKAFVDAKKAGQDTKGIVAAVAQAITTIGPEKISEHCNAQNPAIDLHPASIKNTANFNAILAADSRVRAICPPKDPFYHIVVNS